MARKCVTHEIHVGRCDVNGAYYSGWTDRSLKRERDAENVGEKNDKGPSGVRLEIGTSHWRILFARSVLSLGSSASRSCLSWIVAVANSSKDRAPIATVQRSENEKISRSRARALLIVLVVRRTTISLRERCYVYVEQQAARFT